jgi:hypothetical protein
MRDQLKEWSTEHFNLERVESMHLGANIHNWILINYRIIVKWPGLQKEWVQPTPTFTGTASGKEI